jgi:hypothetical protein
MSKTQILFLRLFAILIQRDDPATLCHSFERGPAALIRCSPFRRNIFGAGDLGKFSQVFF